MGTIAGKGAFKIPNQHLQLLIFRNLASGYCREKWKGKTYLISFLQPSNKEIS